MIRLVKGAKPQILALHEAQWLENLKDAIAAGEKQKIKAAKSKYNHQDIKNSVKAETHGKCAYCEGNIIDVAYGDIEHVFPKSIDIEKTFDWDNLTFACEVCNTNKSDRDPNLDYIIDPYKVEPSDFITFIGAIINGNGTEEGTLTIRHLKLDRPGLAESRLEVLKGLIKSLDNIRRARSAMEKNVLIEDFEENDLSPEREFLAMRQTFWEKFKP